MWLSLPKAAALSAAELDFSPHVLFLALSLTYCVVFPLYFFSTTRAVLAHWLRSRECDPQQPAALQIEMMSTQI